MLNFFVIIIKIIPTFHMKKETYRIINTINQSLIEDMQIDMRVNPIDFLNHIEYVKKHRQIAAINYILTDLDKRLNHFEPFYFLEAKAIYHIKIIFKELNIMSQIRLITKTNAFPNLKLEPHYWSQIEATESKNVFLSDSQKERAIKNKYPIVYFRISGLIELLNNEQNIYTEKIISHILNSTSEVEKKDIEKALLQTLNITEISTKKFNTLTQYFDIKKPTFERLIRLNFHQHIIEYGKLDWLKTVYFYTKENSDFKNPIFYKSTGELMHGFSAIVEQGFIKKENDGALKEFLHFTYLNENDKKECDQILAFLHWIEENKKEINKRVDLRFYHRHIIDIQAMAENEKLNALIKNQISKPKMKL